MNSDFPDFLAELLRAQCRFLIVGAHALAFHGVPRATGDLDIWIDSSPENAKRAWAALVAFGAPVDAKGLVPADLQKPDIVAQLGVPPLRIDILTGISGVKFEDAWLTREAGDFEEVPVFFIGRAAFLANKRAAGRPRDLADVADLEKKQPG